MSAPILWGDWRANANPRFYTGWCPACGCEMWHHRNGQDWRAICMNDERTCSDEEIAAGAARLLDAQQQKGALVDTDDPFYGMPAEEYIHGLTGQEPQHHFFSCPFHDERTPSLHANGALWYCHGCQKGGSIYDFGAALWDIKPRRDGFKELRTRLLDTLVRGGL
jgi:hypothetical protein